jgi:hypothetical protein
MCNLATMKRQRLWLFRQGFTTAAAHMAKAIDAMKQGETE